MNLQDMTLPGVDGVDTLEAINAREIARKRETQAAAARDRARVAREDKAAARHHDAMTFQDVAAPTFFDL